MADLKKNEVEATKSGPTPDWAGSKDKTAWEYVSIPAENALGEIHAPMSINAHQFTAGNTYLVPPKIAETLRDRLHVYSRARVRVLQPNRDMAAVAAVPVGSVGGGTTQAVDASVVSRD